MSWICLTCTTSTVAMLGCRRRRDVGCSKQILDQSLTIDCVIRSITRPSRLCALLPLISRTKMTSPRCDYRCTSLPRSVIPREFSLLFYDLSCWLFVGLVTSNVFRISESPSSLSFLHPSPLPIPCRPPLIQMRCLEERFKLSKRSLGLTPAEIEFSAFMT